jgi:Zn-dependent oligopeptidase
MNQYSAAYYGYLWAEVLSADMFRERFEADPFSAEAGMRYRKQVLAPGGVGKIADHLEKFLGRPPTQEAFLSSRGIL